jgi:2'-5' RNA ligase
VTRAFVAVRLPEAVLDAVADRFAVVPVSGRLTARDQWHVTLQFLGNHADVDAVVAALDGLDARGGIARVGGAGAFPDARRARVLWLGLTEGAAVLMRIAEKIAPRLAPLGHEPDERVYRPHLTLARYPVATDLRPVVAALGAEPVGPAWEIDAITVYESRLHADGPRYVVRATVPLPI